MEECSGLCCCVMWGEMYFEACSAVVRMWQCPAAFYNLLPPRLQPLLQPSTQPSTAFYSPLQPRIAS